MRVTCAQLGPNVGFLQYLEEPQLNKNSSLSFLSLSLSLFHSFTLSLFHSFTLSLFHSFTLSLFLSFSLSLFLFLSFSLFISLSYFSPSSTPERKPERKRRFSMSIHKHDKHESKNEKYEAKQEKREKQLILYPHHSTFFLPSFLSCFIPSFSPLPPPEPRPDFLEDDSLRRHFYDFLLHLRPKDPFYIHLSDGEKSEFCPKKEHLDDFCEKVETYVVWKVVVRLMDLVTMGVELSIR